MPFIPPIPPQPQYKPLVDTKANILATTPNKPKTAFASDTSEFFVYDGTNWKVASIKLTTELANPDSGSENGNTDKQGYGEDYIDNKKATDFGIGAFTGTPYNGAMRVRSEVFPSKAGYYMDGAWQDVPLDISFLNANYTHLPTGYKIDIRSGNSSGKVGLNGIPNVREYQVDSGSTPRHVIIDGGEI